MDNELVEAVALEPCPFCGGEARIGVVGRLRELICRHCEAAGPLCDTTESARRKWNTRTPLASLKAENEALRSALAGLVSACESLEENSFINGTHRFLAPYRAALTKQGG